MASSKRTDSKPFNRPKRGEFLRYRGEIVELTPVSDMYGQSKYRDFSPGRRPSSDTPPQHGPVKVIYSRDQNPVVDAPTKLGMRAGELRRKAPPCEFKLRDALKKHFGDYGIEFQHSVEMFGYIADFYCPTRNLVIELDGPQHASQQEYDRRRDGIFRANGIRVLRFPSKSVYGRSMNGIIAYIAKVLDVSTS